jgi:xanthine dehydrogenase accessory factor
MERNERATVLTVLAVEGETTLSAGDRTTVFADGSTASAERLSGTDRDPLPDGLLEAIATEIPTDSVASLQDSTTVTVPFDGAEITVFCDVYEPIPTLLVFGNQGDIRPVTRFARESGFHVVVVTGRGTKATADQFPAADVVQSVRAPDLAEAVAAPEHTYAVLMSHNFLDDRLALESLLSTAVPYIGLMGPRKRFDEMRKMFENEGRSLTTTELGRISTPVGLDLGGDEPTQIAMSVVAEVLAAANGATGGRLSDRDGAVHGR